MKGTKFMKYAIVYSSKTGNTQALAQAVAQALPREERIYFGPPSPQPLEAQRMYAGFWTDKGTCDAQSGEFFSQMTTQSLFLFGTAGFGGDVAYFERILSAVKAKIPPSVAVVGTYMCQGRMPEAVRRRYEAMEDGPHKQGMLENFDRALSHPDSEDLKALQAAVNAVV